MDQMLDESSEILKDIRRPLNSVYRYFLGGGNRDEKNHNFKLKFIAQLQKTLLGSTDRRSLRMWPKKGVFFG